MDCVMEILPPSSCFARFRLRHVYLAATRFSAGADVSLERCACRQAGSWRTVAC